MKGLSETQIETQICHYLSARGIFVIKIPRAGYAVPDKKKGFRFRRHVSPYVLNGVADLYCVINGQSVWIEVKSEKGVQSDEQIEFERLLKENRTPYHLVRNLEEIVVIADHYKNLKLPFKADK